MTTRKTYTKEFKQQAVRLAEDIGYTQTGRDLDVNPGLIRKWKKRLTETEDGQQAFPGKGNPRDEEMAQLKRDNARLREEEAILKKAVGRADGSISLISKPPN